MQGTGNYKTAFSPSVRSCRYAFTRCEGEVLGVRRVFPVLLVKKCKKSAEELKKSVENLDVTRKMILSLSLSLSYAR